MQLQSISSLCPNITIQMITDPVVIFCTGYAQHIMHTYFDTECPS